ncbi:hypothetical protein L6164_002992 [Bauhinia variegata]|uniref:Uncharacterized protein n=1 Tax=Bauhinia variegata TaxID=167791 RepID=A0ACB9Q023_BAUVA|nr:hypothetical protein L6164_002992 [Bauhinia variegata]
MHAGMENQTTPSSAHCVVLAYPAQGHLNPLLQFAKRLNHRGVKITLVSTHFFWKSISTKQLSLSSLTIESISDGYDDAGQEGAESLKVYLEKFWEVGPQTLNQLLHKLAESGCPADCVVYDSFLPWALDVAKDNGLVGAPFLTQSCAVNDIYFHAHKGLIKVPLSEEKYLLPGLVELEPCDMPSFISVYGSYPVVWQLVVDTFANIGKADWVLSNSVYELEEEVSRNSNTTLHHACY